jgi:hypothetical protein
LKRETHLRQGLRNGHYFHWRFHLGCCRLFLESKITFTRIVNEFQSTLFENEAPL